jgi:hypothetical protein
MPPLSHCPLPTRAQGDFSILFLFYFPTFSTTANSFEENNENKTTRPHPAAHPATVDTIEPESADLLLYDNLLLEQSLFLFVCYSIVHSSSAPTLA